ncbi:hypothetical protein K474DRAFT_1659664 [Panus rudis PR-1116 ss-1]|nr:hypothetical protein K474DRAFT_1659664 [Panus rudis PR-1116 ss-1]
MSSVISPYGPPPTIRSSLFKAPTETIPPTEDLESLHAELKLFREKTLERVRKAQADIRTIEESMRRLREKDKGKSKAVEKIKRERASSTTPAPHAHERQPSSQPLTTPRSRMTPIPPAAAASASSTPSHDPRKTLAEELKKKKKKRPIDEIADPEAPPPKRKPSPFPPPPHPHPNPPKASKHPPLPSSSKAANVPDFSVPPSVPLLPSRPPVPPPPIPGPSKPTDVMEDFSKAKQPNQVLVTTFYTSIEPWLRPIKEEDIGFLEFTGDEVEPYVIPKLGRHYSDVWEEEDIAMYGAPLQGTAAAKAGTTFIAPSTGPLPKWEPSTLTEGDCLNEEHGHGPLNERLVSALIPMKNDNWKGVKAAEEAMEGRPGTNGAAAQAARDRMNVADLEDRIKNALRFHGILDDVPNFDIAVDDPIATALRHAQSELREVAARNKARRRRLAEVARARLAYQEFLEYRDYLDKAITNLYTKLQKKDVPKVSKKKKIKGEVVNGASVNGATPNGTALAPHPAALGFVPDEENHLTVPEQLKQLVEARKQWEEIGERILKEYNGPGTLVGTPKQSIFDGVEEEVKRELEKVIPPSNTVEASKGSSSSNASGSRNHPFRPSTSGKGKGRAFDMGS